MKKLLGCFLLSGLFSIKLFSQSSATTLDVVGWNLEFFGASFASGPADKDLQEANTKKIMRLLNADIYGLVEIVDTMRLRRLVDSLGNTEFGFVIAPYCSNNSTGTGNGWLTGQKQAFIYRKSVFSNVITRGLMRTSSTANTNWATGRFPFLLNANVTINTVTKNINFIVIHGKSGSTAPDYDRRRAGALELKDTLDAQYSNTLNIILGDYNDALNQTISTGSGPQSSYQPIIADSTDADHYKSITLPLAIAGQTTMINFPNVIDNHVISNEVVPFYVLNSVQIRTDITSVVPDYVTAHNTSDHWPVFSKYNLSGVITSVPNVPITEAGINAYPNPFIAELNIKAAKTLNNVQLNWMNMQGQVIHSQFYNRINAGSIIQPSIPHLSKGVYFLQVITKELRTVIKLTHLK
ncbi:MAG TPA: T9SS type A sorting domain-containing protein [Chitinophagaceae bacterium]